MRENAFAGPAMARRAGYMYGAMLERGPPAQIGCGLGLTTSVGRNSLYAPTIEIAETGRKERVDGVRFVFQLTPGIEAPAEMNFHFPDHRVLCVAENATHTLHNILTPRGALVRDAHGWARYLNETIELFGADTDVLFAVHHWPIWGTARAIDFLRKQRDLYAYLHDQTLRLLNSGLTGAEIAEVDCRGYYGSVSHDVKAIYQRYMGWFDGNPAHLWEHPPVERARRYVKAIGGIDATLDRAREAAEAGDLRWAAELANHAVFAAPEHEGARELQATVLERLGHGCENATWRNFFLMGAKELRDGIVDTPTVSASPEMVGQVPLEQILDGMAFRINGPRAFGVELSIVFELSDTGEAHTLTLENAVLTHTPGKREDAQATLRLPRPALDELIAETVTTAELFEAERIVIEGDGAKVGELFGLMDEPDPRFAIVTP